MLRGAAQRTIRQLLSLRYTPCLTVESGVASAVQKISRPALRCQPFATNSHDLFNMHQQTDYNTADTEFDFTEANYDRVAEILSRYPTNYKQSGVIPVLDIAQQQNNGWLSLAALNRVANILEMAPIRVYEVATFYTMFNRSRVGKYHVMVCGTTPCMLCGSRAIEKALKDHLGVGIGDTTEDGMFTLGEMECLGSCVTGPMVAVADYRNGVEGFSYNYYEDLTPSAVVQLVDDLRAGKTPKLGSPHRNRAEAVGHTEGDRWVAAEPATKTLQGTPSGPYCRDLDEIPPEVKA